EADEPDFRKTADVLYDFHDGPLPQKVCYTTGFQGPPMRIFRRRSGPTCYFGPRCYSVRLLLDSSRGRSLYKRDVSLRLDVLRRISLVYFGRFCSQAACRIGMTAASALGLWTKSLHASMSFRRFSKRSPRLYAASAAFGMVCA